MLRIIPLELIALKRVSVSSTKILYHKTEINVNTKSEKSTGEAKFFVNLPEMDLQNDTLNPYEYKSLVNKPNMMKPARSQLQESACEL